MKARKGSCALQGAKPPRKSSRKARWLLKRDRQSSLFRRPARTHSQSQTAKPKASTKKPGQSPSENAPQGRRRPRLSSFRCNCQTALRSRLRRPRAGLDQTPENDAKPPSQTPAKFDPNPNPPPAPQQRAKQKNQHTPPRLSAGRSAFTFVPKASSPAARKRAKPSAEAGI